METDTTPALSTDDIQTTQTGDEQVNLTITVAYIPPLVLLVLFTCVANIVVILCVYVEKRLHKATNLYVVSLAVADTVVGLLVMNGMLVYTVYGLWPLSDGLCTVWIVTDFSCCTVSMLHLCLIAHDRYQALVKPLQYKSPHRTRNILLYIVAAWIVGVLVWLPAIIVLRYSQPPVAYDCYFIPDRTYVLFQAIFVYFMPIIIMAFFYVMCLYGLRVQYRKIEVADGLGDVQVGNIQSVQPSSSLGVSIQDDTGSSYITSTTGKSMKEEGATVLSSSASTALAIRQKKNRRRNDHIRSIRTLGVIIIIFLFCWLPFCLFWPISAYCPDCIPLKWYEYSYWAAYLNSSVNPLLYFLCNRDFRVALKHLMKAVCRSK